MSKHRQPTSRKGPDRSEYLSQLVQEYLVTSSVEAKQQVLANLANFAYDPMNYEDLWQANAFDVFITGLEDPDPLLKEFGAGGLANICTDPKHRQYIFSEPGYIEVVKQLILSEETTNEAVINAMAALILLVDTSSKDNICTSALKEGLMRLRTNGNSSPQVRSMATLFLNDYFH